MIFLRSSKNRSAVKRTPWLYSLQTRWCCRIPVPLRTDILEDNSSLSSSTSAPLLHALCIAAVQGTTEHPGASENWVSDTAREGCARPGSRRQDRRRDSSRMALSQMKSGEDYQLTRLEKEKENSNISISSHFSVEPSNSGYKENSCWGVLKIWLGWLVFCGGSFFYKGQINFLMLFSTLMLLL